MVSKYLVVLRMLKDTLMMVFLPGTNTAFFIIQTLILVTPFTAEDPLVLCDCRCT